MPNLPIHSLPPIVILGDGITLPVDDGITTQSSTCAQVSTYIGTKNLSNLSNVQISRGNIGLGVGFQPVDMSSGAVILSNPMPNAMNLNGAIVGSKLKLASLNQPNSTETGSYTYFFNASVNSVEIDAADNSIVTTLTPGNYIAITFQAQTISGNPVVVPQFLSINGFTNSNVILTLLGDVTGNLLTNIVATVGGKTAAQIAASVNATLSATASNTPNTLALRNGTAQCAFNDIFATTISKVGGSNTNIDFIGQTISNNSNKVIFNYGLSNINDLNGILSIDSNNRILKDQSGINSLDWSQFGRIMYDSGAQTSINYRIRELFNNSGNPVLNWNILTLIDSSGEVSLEWQARLLFDSTGIISQDYQNRVLYDASGGVPTVDYGNAILEDLGGTNSILWDSSSNNGRRLLDDFGNPTVNWHLQTLIDSSGPSTSINWDIRLAYRENGSVSIDYQNSYLTDQANVNAVAWNIRQLLDASGLTSQDFNLRHLLNAAGGLTVDYGQSLLLSSGINSLDFQNRNLVANDGSSNLNWANPGFIQIRSVTTAQRNAFIPSVPTTCYDSDLNQYFGWNVGSSSWVVLG
jgi:hypothetical protein